MIIWENLGHWAKHLLALSLGLEHYGHSTEDRAISLQIFKTRFLGPNLAVNNEVLHHIHQYIAYMGHLRHGVSCFFGFLTVISRRMDYILRSPGCLELWNDDPLKAYFPNGWLIDDLEYQRIERYRDASVLIQAEIIGYDGLEVIAFIKAFQVLNTDHFEPEFLAWKQRMLCFGAYVSGVKDLQSLARGVDYVTNVYNLTDTGQDVLGELIQSWSASHWPEIWNTWLESAERSVVLGRLIELERARIPSVLP